MTVQEGYKRRLPAFSEVTGYQNTKEN